MPRFSANLSTLFTESPLVERFAAARRAGFRAVEIQFPYDTAPEALVRAKRDAGVEIALINCPAGDLAEGGPGLAAMPGREADFRCAVEDARQYARALKPRCMNVLAGRPPATLGRERCMETLARNLRHAADVMEDLGTRVTVEAINPRDRPGSFLASTPDAVSAIAYAGHPNLAIQYDVYHMQIVEGDLTTTLETNIDRIGHIQFADVPGRGEPGTGEINFDHLFQTLDRLQYKGWIGAEYVPTGDTMDSFGWFKPYRSSQRRRERRARNGQELQPPAC